MADADHVWESLDGLEVLTKSLGPIPTRELQAMLLEREREHFEQRRRDYAEDARRNAPYATSMEFGTRLIAARGDRPIPRDESWRGDDRLFREFLDGGSIPLRLELLAMRTRLRCTLPGRYRRAQAWSRTQRCNVAQAAFMVSTGALNLWRLHSTTLAVLALATLIVRCWLVASPRRGDAPEPITS